MFYFNFSLRFSGTMKKLYLFFAVLCCAHAAKAQFIIGVKAGYGNAWQSKPTAEEGKIHTKNQFFSSWQAGVMGEWKFSKHFSLQPALMVSSRGGKSITDYSRVFYDAYGNLSSLYLSYYEGSDRLYYLDLPINLLYNLKAGKGNFFAGAGGYISTRLSEKLDGAKVLQDMPFNSSENGILTFVFQSLPLATTNGVIISPNNHKFTKSTDAGANFTLGYTFHMGLQLSLDYRYGLDNTHYGKNRAATLNIAYLFKR